MKNIVVFAGSNSKTSINRKFGMFAAQHIREANIDNIDLSQIALPLYSPDLEAESGIPNAVNEIDLRIESADGLIVALAEYNGSYAAAFKNAFDWLSRINMKVWKDKPMFLITASPGRSGGKRVMEVASHDFGHFGGMIKASFSLPSFSHTFVDEELIEPELKTEFSKQVSLFQDALC